MVASFEGGDSLLTSAETGFPRISYAAYEAINATIIAVTIPVALCRLYFSIRRGKMVNWDDGFFMLAFLSYLASTIVAWQWRGSLYLQMEISTGMVQFQLDDLFGLLQYFKLLNVSNALLWTALYAVKLSFLFVFRKLVVRITLLEIYSWFILAILIISACISIPLSLYICSDLTLTIFESCPLAVLAVREQTYINLSCSLDIATDVLILSMPILILARINIDTKKKLEMGATLCLSFFMVIVAIIRMAFCHLRRGDVDSTWLSAWLGVEGCLAILMVSSTHFRAIWCQRRSAAKEYSSAPSSYRNFNWNQSRYNLPGLPARAFTRMKMMVLRRDATGSNAVRNEENIVDVHQTESLPSLVDVGGLISPKADTLHPMCLVSEPLSKDGKDPSSIAIHPYPLQSPFSAASPPLPKPSYAEYWESYDHAP